MAKGIDVYTKYQRVNDWNAVRRAGYEFAYVKVSDGLTTRATNGYGPAGRKAGVKMGGYHFVQVGDPILQARHFVGLCRVNELLDLAPALDMEDNPPGSGNPNIPDAHKAEWTIQFCREVHRLGQRPAVYCNNSVAKLIQAKVNNAVSNVIWWIARYGANPTVSWDVFQHSDQGKVPGIAAGSVDLNLTQGSYIPLNVIPGPVGPGESEEDIMTGVHPETLPYSGNHPDAIDGWVNVAYPIEVGSNSSLIAAQWVVLNSAWGELDYELILVGQNQTLVAPAGGNGYATNGTLDDRQRAVWALPSGCEGVALRYRNNGAWARAGIAFPQRTK